MLLRQAYRQEQTLPESAQQDAVRRVEERLARGEEGAASFAEWTPGSAGDVLLRRSRSKLPRQKTLMRALSTIAAVLVVGILIGSAVLLFTRSTRSLAGRTGTLGQSVPTSTPNSVDVKWDGLEMSMKITPGPYFLGEIVAVDLSLTNHRQQTLRLGGTLDGPESSPFPCGSYSLFPTQTGGTSPHYSLYTEPVQFIYSCPAMFDPGPNQGTMLAPEKTVADHFYVLLTGSGDVTLLGEAYLYIPGMGIQREGQHPGPLTGHLPVLHIHVASQVPADRMLSIQQESSVVRIHAPTGVQLVDQMYILCQSSPTDRGTPGGDPVGNASWHLLSAHTLQRPACLNSSGWVNGQPVSTQWTSVLWKYAIGAVGYEVVQGQSVEPITSHP